MGVPIPHIRMAARSKSTSSRLSSIMSATLFGIDGWFGALLHESKSPEGWLVRAEDYTIQPFAYRVKALVQKRGFLRPASGLFTPRVLSDLRVCFFSVQWN